MSTRPALLLLVALGCARPAPPTPADSTPVSVSATQVSEIRLERTAVGHPATGPAYVFTLHREGLSTYEGKSGVPMLGDYHVVIPEAAFSALVGRLLADGFFTRRSVYTKGQCSIAPGLRVTLTVDGTAEAVAPPCPSPEFEKEIMAPIDSVAGRLPWSASLRL